MSRLTRRLVLIGALALVARPVVAQTPPDPAAAESAASTWLALVDAERYGDSWTSASPAFKQAVTQEQWQAAVAKVRNQLGALTSRTKARTNTKTNPPGAPPGDYVILQYNSAFAQRATATETVTALRDADGTFRIVGYFVQ